jgi:predicted DNA-binding transcriptional regulator AlpA
MEILSNAEVETKYLRAKGIAKRYSIGLSTVWKLSQDGKIIPHKIGAGTTVFKVDEVEKALFGEVA